MSYLDDICEPLIGILERSAMLPRHQLAGHAANLSFWLLEAKHCLQAIEGYEERFERMKQAQEKQATLENIREAPLQKGVGEKSRKQLEQRVIY